MKSHVLLPQLQQLSAFSQNNTLKTIDFAMNSFCRNFYIGMFYNVHEIYRIYEYANIQCIILHKSKVCTQGSTRVSCRTPLHPALLSLLWPQCQFTVQSVTQCTCWPTFSPAQALYTFFLCFLPISASIPHSKGIFFFLWVQVRFPKCDPFSWTLILFFHCTCLNL